MRLIKLFVYGTMKKGFSNHWRISEQSFINNVKTVNKYVMYSHASYQFPCMFDEIGDAVIKGELYEVSIDVLSMIDKYEGVPLFYDKMIIKVVDSDGKEYEAYAYFYQKEKSPENIDEALKYDEWTLELEDCAGVARGLNEVLRR